MSSHLAICDDEGLPLWGYQPTIENVQRNVLVMWMKPFVPCVVIIDYGNGTSLVAYDGVIAFAVSECLYEVI